MGDLPSSSLVLWTFEGMSLSAAGLSVVRASSAPFDVQESTLLFSGDFSTSSMKHFHFFGSIVCSSGRFATSSGQCISLWTYPEWDYPLTAHFFATVSENFATSSTSPIFERRAPCRWLWLPLSN